MALSDDIRVCQEATDTYVLHEFKNFAGASTAASLKVELQSELAPTLSTVYLQIFNQVSSTWETVASNSTAAASTDFVMTALVPDLTNYKDADNVITCRVYQVAI